MNYFWWFLPFQLMTSPALFCAFTTGLVWRTELIVKGKSS